MEISLFWLILLVTLRISLFRLGFRDFSVLDNFNIEILFLVMLISRFPDYDGDFANVSVIFGMV